MNVLGRACGADCPQASFVSGASAPAENLIRGGAAAISLKGVLLRIMFIGCRETAAKWWL